MSGRGRVGRGHGRGGSARRCIGRRRSRTDLGVRCVNSQPFIILNLNPLLPLLVTGIVDDSRKPLRGDVQMAHDKLP